jgi:hypothetical protein
MQGASGDGRSVRAWQFDVIVAMNLFCGILSDPITQQAGRLGLAPGAHISRDGAVIDAAINQRNARAHELDRRESARQFADAVAGRA